MARRRSWKSIFDKLNDELAAMTFAPPVAAIYNPLEYARAVHDKYLRRYGQGKKKAVFLGMNPGPWGMAQTGVPFGEISFVRDWLQIEARVNKPDVEHPKRPIAGFECTRSEVSGRRFWGYLQELFGEAESFFADYFVLNYCPLVFMEEGGRNRTPDKLPRAEREALFAACDEALRAVLDRLQPRVLIGVGRFAADRGRVPGLGDGLEVAQILHPSPASPLANRGWAEVAHRQLGELDIDWPRFP